MTKEAAMWIGSRLAIKSMLIGLLIAQAMMTLVASDNGLLKGLFWFADFDFLPNIIFAVVVSIVGAYYFGRIAGLRILINGNNEILVGILTGLLIIISSSFLTGWIEFFNEEVYYSKTITEAFKDYVLKPVYVVTLYGFIPVIIVGTIYGIQVKKYKED